MKFSGESENAMIDDPTEEDLYTVGTICKVVSNHKKDGFSRIVFKGVARAT